MSVRSESPELPHQPRQVRRLQASRLVQRRPGSLQPTLREGRTSIGREQAIETVYSSVLSPILVSDRARAALTRANTHDLRKIADKNLSIADFPSFGGVDDCLDDLFSE